MKNSEKKLQILRAEIEKYNLGWEAEDYSSTDLSAEDLDKTLGYDYESEETTSEQEAQKSRKNYREYIRLLKAKKTSEVPDTVDWRNFQGKSYVTKVKNQGTCGSCVSFATAGVIESIARYRARSPEPSSIFPLLSEASIHFCAGRACEGWNLSSAFSYAQKNGVVPESYFPYKGYAEPCRAKPEWDAVRTKIYASHEITSIDEMIRWLAEKGPLATRFDVYDDFYSYKSGIYHKSPSAVHKGGHAVLCVGYDTVNHAWICKNSWGSSRGENGYFRIGMGECGIDAKMYAIDSLAPLYPVYTDVMLRDNLQDFGQAKVTGSVCASPDIIPVGLDALDNPQKKLTESWFQDIGQNLTANANNVIYLRGISHNSRKTKAKFYLYYSKASLLLYPDQWKNNLIPCSSGTDYFETEQLNQGDLAVTQLPYIWKPSAIEKNDHYCLIGRIVTEEHPNPIPSAQDVKDFAKFIACNPNYSMRNIVLVDKDVPDYSVEIQYAQGNIGATMHFVIENSGCSEDAEFSVSCTNSSVEAPIKIERQKVPKNGQLTGIHADIPKDFNSQILLNFWNKNAEKSEKEWALCLKVFYIPEEQDRKEIRNTAVLQYGTIKPVQAVLLGGYTIKAAPK